MWFSLIITSLYIRYFAFRSSRLAYTAQQGQARQNNM